MEESKSQVCFLWVTKKDAIFSKEAAEGIQTFLPGLCLAHMAGASHEI
jgi:hypothetical protein